MHPLWNEPGLDFSQLIPFAKVSGLLAIIGGVVWVVLLILKMPVGTIVRPHLFHMVRSNEDLAHLIDELGAFWLYLRREAIETKPSTETKITKVEPMRMQYQSIFDATFIDHSECPLDTEPYERKETGYKPRTVEDAICDIADCAVIALINPFDPTLLRG